MVQVGLIMIYSVTLCPGPLIPALSTAIDLMVNRNHVNKPRA